MKSGYINYILTLDNKTIRIIDKKTNVSVFILNFNYSFIGWLIYHLIKFDSRKT